MENNVLSCVLNSKESYTQLAKYVNKHDFSEIGRLVYDSAADFYEKDSSASRVDIPLLLSKLEHKYPKKIDLLSHVFDNLPEDVSYPNVLEYFRDLRKEQLGMQIASSLLGGKNNVGTLMEDYLAETVSFEEEAASVYNLDAADLLTKTHGGDLIPIYPSVLSKKLGGGIPRQGQALIYARPDTGKSTVAMNIAGGAALNGFRVLYCGNEDPSILMTKRFIQRVTGKTKSEVEADLQGAINVARQSGAYQNFMFHPMTPGTIAEIRGQVEKFQPDIVIVDQVRLLDTGQDGPTLSLERACIDMRTMAKEYSFVSILLTQAGESAHNKLILEMNDVEWSNTGVQGQMDLMIGVGQNPEWKENNRVMLSFPKNKLTEPIKPFDCRINYPLQKILGPQT